MVEHTLYADTDDPVVITFDEGTHRYKIDGKLIDGVTTVQSIIAKPELIQWAANMAVEAIGNGATPREARYAHQTRKDSTADLGTRVHAWIEEYFKGNTQEIPEELQASIESFLKWVEIYNPKTEFSERIVYSKKHNYAGKLDWGGTIKDRYGIVDFKTGSFDKQYNPRKKIYTGAIRARTSHFIQNAGYDIPIEEEDGVTAHFYGVLYIQLDGTMAYFETVDTGTLREAFVKTLETKRLYKKANGNNKWKEK